MKQVVVICGPTASGKTTYAHIFAKKHDGQIVNADSMQLYKDIPIITASPDIAFKNQLSYHLYNFLDIKEEYSVAKYTEIAAQKIRSITAIGKLPVLVGGSGMYISALINGLSSIPATTPEIRTKVRDLQDSLSAPQFFTLLKEVDPEITKILKINDKQRVARAYEVYLQTGKSILFFQQSTTKLLADFTFKIILLLPERSFLYSMCNQRLEQMFKSGGIEEVEALMAQNQGKPLESCAIIKALGVQEIKNYLRSLISKEEALEQAQIRTRNYAKRQITWFTNQIKDKIIINFANKEEYDKILRKLRN